MKKLIYEVFYSKANGGEPFVNIYSDGSFEFTDPDLVTPCDDPSLEKSRLLRLEFKKEEIEETIQPDLSFCSRWLYDWYDNPRYEDAYFTLRAATQRIYPFRGYRIVYHGEGKPWKRVDPEGTVF